MGEISGYLRTEGRNIVNNDGIILLDGWGVGNWLVPEGYMWLSDGRTDFDRPRRIEHVIEDLTGHEYAVDFWKNFRDNFVTYQDIKAMAEIGCNSIRIPINWRILMEEEKGTKWNEDGFLLLDRCIRWCTKCGLYVFLDLHAAPGGQTGANIDDSLNNMPGLYTDQDAEDKCVALWGKLADRYSRNETVGGYDLLNEPICPPHDGVNNDGYIPKLMSVYKRIIAEIRKTDTKHMITVEGTHWATDLTMFDKKIDDNMVLHIHRYAEKPEISSLKQYIKKSMELDVPLWVGETGENNNEWCAAYCHLLRQCGIGYNLWPWKKMETGNSFCSVRKPEGYERIFEYLDHGKKLCRTDAQKILNEVLENIKYCNCELHPEIMNHVRRIPPFEMYAVDFDEFPGKGVSFSGINGNCRTGYRDECGMRLVTVSPKRKPLFAFDSMWDRYAIKLGENEFVEYSLGGISCTILIKITVKTAGGDAAVRISSGTEMHDITADNTNNAVSCRIRLNNDRVIRIETLKGCIVLRKIMFGTAE